MTNPPTHDDADPQPQKITNEQVRAIDKLLATPYDNSEVPQDDAESEAERVEERFQERLLDSGACTCTWDANPEEGGPDDVVVEPDPDCLAHTMLTALHSESRRADEAERERDEALRSLHPARNRFIVGNP